MNRSTPCGAGNHGYCADTLCGCACHPSWKGSLSVLMDLWIQGVSGEWISRFKESSPSERWAMLAAVDVMNPKALSFSEIRSVIHDQ